MSVSQTSFTSLCLPVGSGGPGVAAGVQGAARWIIIFLKDFCPPPPSVVAHRKDGLTCGAFGRHHLGRADSPPGKWYLCWRKGWSFLFSWEPVLGEGCSWLMKSLPSSKQRRKKCGSSFPFQVRKLARTRGGVQLALYVCWLQMGLSWNSEPSAWKSRWAGGTGNKIASLSSPRAQLVTGSQSASRAWLAD